MHAMPSGAQRLTVTQWLIVSMAAIGFAFDIYELLMMPLIITAADHGPDRLQARQRRIHPLGLAGCFTCRRSPAAFSACWAAT